MRIDRLRIIAGLIGCVVGLAILSSGVVAAQTSEGIVVTCLSTADTHEHCAGYTRSGVVVLESIGTVECVLGRTWGYDASGVWVAEGCGARFLLGKPAAAIKHRGESRDRDLGDYLAYTRFGAQLAYVDGEFQVQDASSRVGFEYGYGEKIRFLAATELSIRLTKNVNPFYPGESTSSGYLLLEENRDPVFGIRLGYVGLDFGECGRITLGKQWSVHYDIAGFTDIFNVFGAEASTTFNAGTDGGFMGTGRVDSAILYRNELIGIVDVGAQLQFRDLSNGEAIDGYGVSARVHILPRLTAGASYTRARFDDSAKGVVFGLRGDGQYTTFGIRYEGNRVLLAGVYAKQKNGDLLRIPGFDVGEPIVLPVVFDGNGVELAGRYQAGRLGLLAGYLDYRPDRLADSPIDPDAELNYYLAGLDYELWPPALFFVETRFAHGFDGVGVPGEDVYVLGFKFHFRKSGTIRLD